MSRKTITFSSRVAQVRQLSPKLRIAALGEALTASSPAESEALAPELLELAVFPAFDNNAPSVRAAKKLSIINHLFVGRRAVIADRALAEISRAWAYLPASAMPAALAVGEGRWKDVIRQVATDPARAARLSLAKLVGDAGDTALASVAVSMLLDRDDDVVHSAERSVILLCLAALTSDLGNASASAFIAPDPESSLGRGIHLRLAGSFDELAAKVLEGVVTFGEHQRRAPILGMLMLSDRARLRAKNSPGFASLRAWLESPDHPSHSALRSVLRWSRLPISRLRALEWLNQPHLSRIAGERLLKAHTLLEHELVLSASHLLARPARAIKAAQIKLQPNQAHKPAAPFKRPAARPAHADGPIPSASTLRNLTPAARRGLPLFLSRLNTTAPVRRAALEPLLTDPSPTIRHIAMRAMPLSALPDFCFDKDPTVSRSAMLAFSTAGAQLSDAPSADHRRLLSHLARSPHESTRTWAAQDLAAIPDSTSASLAGRLAARHLLVQDRPAFLSGLRAELKTPNALQTLLLIRALSLVPDLEPDLITLSTNSATPARLLATIASALRELASAPARSAVAALLTHPDDRVRANAIEAAACHHPNLNTILELKSDPNHRVRVNAIRAHLRAAATGEATAPDLMCELTQLLTDARTPHRLAGVWLAHRALPGRATTLPRWPELVARIGEAARHDENPRVRARAAACSQRLATDLRKSWHCFGPAYART